MSAAVLHEAHSRPRLASYGAVAATALRQGLSERSAVLGRAAFYAVILLIFSRLWAVVIESGALVGRSEAELLWYLAITEWVILSIPAVWLDIERDVRSGDIACQLPRPLSYVGAKIAEGAGDALLRLATLGVAGFLLAWAMTGSLPDDPRGLLLVVPLVIAAVGVGLIFNAAIGLAAFWLQDCAPVYWIWQKLAFILGGLLLPLEIYPDWLRELAFWTPFSALMHGPGRMAFGWDPAFAAEVALRLLLWGGAGAGALAWTYRRALPARGGNGG